MEKRKKVYFGNLWIWLAKRLPWDRSGCGGSGCSRASSSLFNVTCHSVQTVRVRVLCSGENYVNETKVFFYLYHKLLQHSFSKHIKQADFWKIKNNRKTNTKRVFSFHLQYYITWLCQAMDVCVLPCVKSSLFATLEDLQGYVWFWFAHRWKTTTSGGEMWFTAQTKLLMQEFPWSYTLLLIQLRFDLELSSPRLKAYILLLAFFGIIFFFWQTYVPPPQVYFPCLDKWTQHLNMKVRTLFSCDGEPLKTLWIQVLRPAGAQQLPNTQKKANIHKCLLWLPLNNNSNTAVTVTTSFNILLQHFSRVCVCLCVCVCVRERVCVSKAAFVLNEYV